VSRALQDQALGLLSFAGLEEWAGAEGRAADLLADAAIMKAYLGVRR